MSWIISGFDPTCQRCLIYGVQAVICEMCQFNLNCTELEISRVGREVTIKFNSFFGTSELIHSQPSP